MGFFTFLYQASGLQVSIFRCQSPRPPAAVASSLPELEGGLRTYVSREERYSVVRVIEQCPGRRVITDVEVRTAISATFIVACHPGRLDTGAQGYMRPVGMYASNVTLHCLVSIFQPPSRLKCPPTFLSTSNT